MKYSKTKYAFGMIGCLILGLTPVVIISLYHVPIMNYFNSKLLKWAAFVIFVGPVVLAYWFTLKLWDYKLKSQL